MIYHGRISYSLIDNFINNRVIDNDKYILEEVPGVIMLNEDMYKRVEKKMNEWVDIDIYSRISKDHCMTILKSEDKHIKEMFARQREMKKFM